MSFIIRIARGFAAATTLVLVLAACAGGSGPAPSAGVPSPAAAERVTLADFVINPSDVVVSGSSVSFEVTNDGPTPHNLTVRTANDEVVAATPDLRRQESASLSAELAPGEYVLFCSLPGHESLGMRTSLTVGAP